ncbi:MAG: 16S rRNA (cytidine(1402)-2'-O)-methyltransferase [Dehalococcoidia bacterium]|nr:MAG: 16S rRNA (cytidine(1402)-2'-O)-methyltransferase [Dehalococcoidia bacterium]
MGTLYLVATPIGNLQDITLRALDVLRAVSLVAAEDTRSARQLLDHFGIKARLTSYNEHNARARTPSLLDALAAGDVAVVSDAGMPGISDPGHHLVVAAVEAGHAVVPIPGASAVVAAVAASGLPSRRFHYLGFLPRQSGPRRAALRAAAASGDTLVVYESPHRLRQTLADALAELGDRRIAACRELTKLYEEIWRGSVTGALEHFAEPRGEFTLVIEGGPAAGIDGAGKASDVGETIAELRASGTPSRQAVAELMRRCGLARRAAYAAWHRED